MSSFLTFLCIGLFYFLLNLVYFRYTRVGTYLLVEGRLILFRDSHSSQVSLDLEKFEKEMQSIILAVASPCFSIHK